MKYKLIGPIICVPENTTQTNKCPKFFTVSSCVFEYKSLFQLSTSLDRRSVIKQCVEDAFKRGINFFHVGGLQHESEALEIFSESVQSFRDKIIIALTFDVVESAHRIEELILQNCVQLGIECIDIVQLDCANDASVDLEPVMLIFKQLLSFGKINGVGLSNASAAQIEYANRIFPLTIVRSDYSFLSENFFDSELVNICKSFGIVLSVHTDLSEDSNYSSGQLRVISEIAEKYCFTFKKVISIWMISQGIIPCIDITGSDCLVDCLSINNEELTFEELKQLTSVFEAMPASQYWCRPKLGCY